MQYNYRKMSHVGDVAPVYIACTVVHSYQTWIASRPKW
jgi:hypothetical protein